MQLPADDLARLLDLYDRGLYLQAWRAVESFGPPPAGRARARGCRAAEWIGLERGGWAGRLWAFWAPFVRGC